MEFFTLHRSPGVTRACLFSIARRIDHAGVGPLAGQRRVDVLRSEFVDVLASVPDHRDTSGRRYPLAGLLAIAILATAAGMRGYAGFATWAATAETVATGGLLAVAVDGKTLRAARRMGAPATHLVAVFAHHVRLVLGQLAVAEKSNEMRGDAAKDRQAPYPSGGRLAGVKMGSGKAPG